MRFAKHDHVVETFAADRADESLNVSILPGRSGCDRMVPNAHCTDPLQEDWTIRGVSIANEISRRVVDHSLNELRRPRMNRVSLLKALCVPNIRFCNIDGEGRQGQVVRRRRRGAQSSAGEGRPCSEIDGSSTHYNRRHIRVGSGAGAVRQTRSCGRDIRGGSSR